MTKRIIAKCLKTQLVHGTEQVTYLLPYEGNLTAAKFKDLAERFAKLIAPIYMSKHGVSYDNVKDALEQRLKSEWYTGREKGVSIEPDKFGTYTLKGENWFCYGWPEHHFKVVDSSLGNQLENS